MRDASTAQVIRFGHDGWHGQLAREVTFESIEAISRAAGLVMCRDEPENARVVVGYDRRFLGDQFARTIATQLASLGIEPWLIPLPVPTPVLSFAVRSVAAAGGIMVTAGSRAPAFSGIKLRSDDGGPLPRVKLDEIERMLADGGDWRPIGPTATVVETDPVEEYLEAVARQVPVKAIQSAGLTIAIDSMWGAASELLPRMTDGDGSRSVEIRTTYNPRFPDLCAPDPVEKNLTRLMRTVQSGSAAFGVAFGGDGSRLGLIDDRGEYVPAEQVFTIVAYYLLSVKRLRGLVGCSVAMPSDVPRLAATLGISVREFGIGLTGIAERFRQDDYRIASDEAGNVIVPRHLPDSDAILTAMLLCACVVETGQTISEIREEIENQIGRRHLRWSVLPLTDDQMELIDDRLDRARWPAEMGDQTVEEVQQRFGVRFALEGEAWLLVRLDRYSDTLVVVAEAPQQETAEDLVETGRKLMLL